MSEATSAPWWEELSADERVHLGFVKIDRHGSTEEWDELPEDELLRRRARYVQGVEYVAASFGAAQPLRWQGDGVMLFLIDGDEPAPVRAYRAARLLWERVRVDLNMPARIAAHGAAVRWDPDTGKLAHPAIDLCGHLEHAAPTNGIAVTEDVYLLLPEPDRAELAALGVTRRDGIPAWVYPAGTARKRTPEAYTDDRDLALWQKFRAYAGSSEIARLRYVGFRLQEKEPPSLDLRDVFTPMEVEERRGAELPRAVLESLPEDLPLRLPFGRELQTTEPSGRERFERVFADRRSLVVLGDPGSGKSTLVRWLAVEAARGRYALSRTAAVDERLLPLPVSVGRLADVRSTLHEPSVVGTMAAYFAERNLGFREELTGFLTRQLERGTCLVLLDGLDEVRAEVRAGIQEWLESFATSSPTNRFVATSRLVGYTRFHLPDVHEVVLQPFRDDDLESWIRAFARAYLRWEGATEVSIAAAEESERFLRTLRASPRLLALARNPFLLSALALIHRAGERLPRHRVLVYEMFARALCETWGTARRLLHGIEERDIPYEEEALPILGDLAVAMHEQHPTGVAPEAFVVETLAASLTRAHDIADEDARRVARAFLERAGRELQILYERGAGYRSFLHLTFQEFFAAAGLHASERFEETALKHLFEPRWREVIRLGVGYMALVQKRPEATRRFLDKVRIAGDPDRPG